MELQNGVEKYLQILTDAEHELLRNFLASLDGGSSSNPIQSYHEPLQQLLLTKPYPVLKILNENYNKAKYYIGRIIAAALQTLLERDDDIRTESVFINFIANFPLQILEAKTLQDKLYERLLSWSTKLEIYYAILARSDAQLLNTFQERLQQTWLQLCKEKLPSKQFILHRALKREQHFVPLICAQLRDFSTITDITVRNNLLILKLTDDFSNGTQTLDSLGQLHKSLNAFNLTDTPTDLREIHQYFYADFQRLNVVIEFLRKYPDVFKTIKVETLLKTPGVLSLLYDNNIEASYEETFRLIQATYRWQEQAPALVCIREQELETLNYYAALATIYDIIANDDTEQFYTRKLQHLNVLLRHIRSINSLCSILEDIFQMIFLRWEQLQAVSNECLKSTRKIMGLQSSDDDADGYNNEDETTTRKHTNTSQTTRHGFICRGAALQSIFSFLKHFVTKKLHSEDYKCATEHLQLRFQRLVDIINEALWKYSILEKIDESMQKTEGIQQQKLILEPEELLQLVQMHAVPQDKISSDDDSLERCNYASLTRRKTAKKRRRATISGIETFMQARKQLKQNDTMISSTSAAHARRSDAVEQLRAHNLIKRFTDRSIIPKMLGTPENLAIMALALKNFNDVKYIIETFHLQNSALNRELHFVEQQQQIKQKLSNIYSNYLLQEEAAQRHSKNGTNQPLATVEQIKIVAAKGFEMSKIISVVDNFAQTHKIQQSAELKQLLQKYISNGGQYEFMKEFEERNLNAIIIMDLVINLPLNREITANLLTVIRRQQQINNNSSSRKSSIDISSMTTSTAAATTPTFMCEKSQLPKEIGPMSLLENLCECMRLLAINDVAKPLNELLYNNSYSLKPAKLATQLAREHIFKQIYYKKPEELRSCESLKAYTILFQQLKSRQNYFARFCNYLTQLERLLQLRDANVVYHTSELIKHDPYIVIGELIYECNMTPLEIEASVSALNLNLVHVIALNICPDVAANKRSILPKKLKVTAQKQETIYNYIAQQNKLLAFLLQATQEQQLLTKLDEDIYAECLQRLLDLPVLEKLANMYQGNRVVAALCADKLSMRAFEQLTDKRTQLDILLLMQRKAETKNLRAKRTDRLITELIAADCKNITLAVHINDIELRARLLQDNFTNISTTRLAKELIESTLQHKNSIRNIPTAMRVQLEHTLADITVYARVSEVLQFETWPQAYDFGRKIPNTIFEQLLQLQLYQLCYEWCGVVNLAEQFAPQQNMLLATLLDAFLELEDDIEDAELNNECDVDEYLLKILETFPIAACVNFLDTHKDKFRSLRLLNYTIDFLIRHSRDPSSYRNYKISLDIFAKLTIKERRSFWSLLCHPLLIFEQLLMNAKFEILSKAIDAARISLKTTQLSDSSKTPCAYCFDKRGHIYDIHSKNSPHKVRFQLGAQNVDTSASSAFILLNFNLYQKNHIITNECIDLLLRIYATKALDYHISDISSSSEQISQTTDVQMSLDSLCGVFQMPKMAPTREDWVRDEEVTHCMCCRRARFTILLRRHHCRRCGRVVCFACSTNRMRISELYEDVEVRICNECHDNCNELAAKKQEKFADSNSERPVSRQRSVDWDPSYKWRLSGNITHDKLLREEFCYEHAPSVALSLSILGYHLGQQKCVDLLLYHCRKLEKLIVPNPEVDYELVAKMMNCLAVAAKVRGATADVESIREHSEIIMSVVQNGCEALIPPGPLSNHSLRKLADSLVQAEHWSLALDVHLKCGFPTTGVLAAHGLSCLRAGCYDTAREKFSHCMTRLSTEHYNGMLYKQLFNAPNILSDTNDNQFTALAIDATQKKRPNRGPPLLQEILKLIAAMPLAKPQPETLQRASLIRNSNTSLASLFSRRKEPFVATPLHEPALNVLNTLANLKHIAKGHYGDGSAGLNGQRTLTRAFEESIHYVLTYGSHADILQFLIQEQQLSAALKYYLHQQLDAELFVQNIFLSSLRIGQLSVLIQHMQQIAEDSQLSIWRTALMHTCAYLEKQKQLNALYQLQLLLKDPIRASMTCVKFYSMHCENFQQLHANAQHLRNAHLHLQTELELAQWDNMELPANRKNSFSSSRRSSNVSTTATRAGASLAMQMDARALNAHINTILRQLDVAKFLAQCEQNRQSRADDDNLLTMKILKQIRIESQRTTLPTLFEGAQDKVQLCILILLCGKNIEEGFGLAYRIIQDYKLTPMKVFGATAKFLARNQRLPDVDKLLNCITTNNGTSTRDLDELLSIAINSAVNTHEPEVKNALDILAKKINNVELRITSHIFIGQLKSAYLLANKYERLADVRKILRQAELTNQVHIKKLCEKKLNIVKIPPPTPVSLSTPPMPQL